MKTNNTSWSKWIRRASGLMATLLVTMSFAGTASARILFQDDNFHDVDSEGLNLNADDGGDEDIVLKFGNDGTDATITFDDGLTELIYAGADLNWSSATQFRIREDADPAANAKCDHLGELIFDTGSNELQICTATGAGGAATWAPVDTTGGSSTLQGVYNAETANDREILVNAGDNEAVEIRAAANGDDLFELHANDNSVLIGFDDLGGTTIDIDSLIVDWDATGAFNLDSTAAVHIGGGAASEFVTTAGDITIDSQAGSLNLDGGEAAADAVRINASNAAGGIDVDAGTAGIDINTTGTAADSLDINVTGAGGGIDIDTTNGAVAINAAGAANGDVIVGAGDDLTLDAVGLLELNSSAGVISIGNDDIDQNINLGTNGERTINIGNNTGATALNVDANGLIDIASDDGSLTLAASDTDNAGNDNVVLLSGNAAPDAGENGNDIALEAEDDVLIEATGAFDVDAASADITTSGQFAIGTSTWDITGGGAASGFTTIGASSNITTSGGDFIIGTTGLTETTSATDSGAYLVGAFDEFDNSASTNVQDVLDDLDALIGSNAPNVDEMTFEPEYPNYVVYEDGSANKGKLEALYDNTNREQYYSWTSKQAADQDIDIRFRYELPADFVDAGNLTARLRTLTTAAANNTVQVIIRNETDDQTCHTDAATASGTANTWTTVTITGAEIDTGCAAGDLLAAGDMIEIQIKLLADSSGRADVGTLTFDYTN